MCDMRMVDEAKWIRPKKDPGNAAPQFEKSFIIDQPVRKAVLQITGVGIYRAEINAKPVSGAVLAPGWTSYRYRLQVQKYEVTGLIRAGSNVLTVVLGKGWFRSRLVGRDCTVTQDQLRANSAGIIASLEVERSDGTRIFVTTDPTWKTYESRIRFSEIYDGEIYDAAMEETTELGTEVYAGPELHLIEQQGEDGADNDHDEIDVIAHDLIQDGAGLDAGDQIAQHVGDLDGFPGDDKDEAAQGGPAGDQGHLVVERLIGEGHAAAGHGEHGDQLGVAQADGDHHNQNQQVAQCSGHRSAAGGHPAVDGHSPAYTDDGAEADAEKVNCTDAFFFRCITHTYLFSRQMLQVQKFIRIELWYQL